MAEAPLDNRHGQGSATTRLSIIVINWRSALDLAACLDSVYRETPEGLFEVIVVDNASFDGCAEMLEKRFPEVRFIQALENLGFARANNLGAGTARGDVLLFLNPDTLAHDRALEKMFQTATGRADAGAVGARLLNRDGTIQTSCVQSFPTGLNQLLDAGLLRRLAPGSRLWGTRALAASGPAPVPVEAVSGACLMVGRDAFEEVNGFSTDYFMYGEDLDLCFRLAKRGRVNLHCPQAVVTHLGGGSSRSRMRGFGAVMTREAVMRFLATHRGSWSATWYRILMGWSALLRLALLAAAATGKKAVGRPHDYEPSIAKWLAIGHWCWRRREAVVRIGTGEAVPGRQGQIKKCAGSAAS
jgi:hypothetical protein